MRCLQLLTTLVMILMVGHAHAQLCGQAPMLCDADGNRSVDFHDIDDIVLANGDPATGPSDVRDIDGDSQITLLDAQQCVADWCSLPNCGEAGVCENPGDIMDCAGVCGGSSVPDGAGSCVDPTSTQYNVMLIIADDLSFDHYSFAGHPQVQTPSIDALADQSVHYPHTYVSGTCRPTLATLLTGLPEHRHEVTYIAGPALGDYPTVADRLGNAGYVTYQAGKFWEGSPGLRGFTDFLPFTHFTGNLSIGRTSIEPVFNFINESSAPWFVWFSPFMPHAPHTAPSEYTALYEGLGLNAATIEYFAMITWFDSVVGEVLQGVGEDTIIIYVADNGYVQSGFPGSGAANSKGSSYEHGIRTQLLIRHPDHDAVLHTELASAVDVTATILSIAGASYLDLPGRDLLAPPPADAAVFGSGSTLGISSEGGILLHRWMRDGDWKLVDNEDGTDRLHNLFFDPDETQNQIDAPGLEMEMLQTQLRMDLETWWSE